MGFFAAGEQVFSGNFVMGFSIKKDLPDKGGLKTKKGRKSARRTQFMTVFLFGQLWRLVFITLWAVEKGTGWFVSVSRH